MTLYELLEEGRRPHSHSQILALLSGGRLPVPQFETISRDSSEARLVLALMAVRAQDRPSSRRAMEEVLRGPSDELSASRRRTSRPHSVRGEGSKEPVLRGRITAFLGLSLLGILLGMWTLRVS